jgi:hypothetical protein
MNRGRIRQQQRDNAKQAETINVNNNEPRGRIRQQQRNNAIKQAETAINN